MKEDKSLLIRPIPYQDESAASILIRAVEANGYSSVYSLCQNQHSSDPKILDSKVIHQKKYAEIVKQLKFPPEYINLAFKLKGSTQARPRLLGNIYLSNNFFRKDARAFCPKCLEEKLYWRKNWLLRPYTVCLEHHVLLYDNCPNCLKELSIGRSKIHICNYCRFDLRSARLIAADPNIVRWWLDLVINGNQDVINQFSDYWLALEKSNWYSLSDHDLLTLAHQYIVNSTQSIYSLQKLINSKSSQIHPQIQSVYFRKQTKELKKYIDLVLIGCNEVKEPIQNHYQRYFKLVEACAILQISHFRLKNLVKRGVVHVKLISKSIQMICSKEIEYLLLTGLHLE